MRLLSPLAVLTLATVLAAQSAAPPNERTETWPDGTIKQRHTVDEEGQQHGKLEQFAENGTRVLLATYAHGKRDGDWREWRDDGKKIRFLSYQQDQLNGHCEEFLPDGACISVGDYRRGLRQGKWLEIDPALLRRRTSEYRFGLLHGALRIQQKDKVLSRQIWQDGQLIQLDDLQPFPVPREQLRKELRSILAKPSPVTAIDPLMSTRLDALHRLQAYRHLCALPWQTMTLVAEWNLRCDAGAEICSIIGHLDHRPTRPPAMDEARFKLGYEGTSNSNLAINGRLVDSIDSYMDDSDKTNIDRIGHRRWCLNPAMAKTGFGSAGQFHAMWSMDGSGSPPKGIANVCYPPRGYVPVDLFSAGRAFSIALLRGSTPKKEALVVHVQELDNDYLPTGELLPLDWCAMAGGNFGGASCIVFRPTGIAVEPGRKYLIDVSTDGGKTNDYHYLIELCAAVGDSDDEVK
ncbi:hypothetical protein LBMAG49_00450 [Planctomycetota bacterium]|nr:hypothetical protein LBMAG49_00450 [Planctomycetota bacterium]